MICRTETKKNRKRYYSSDRFCQNYNNHHTTV